MRRGNRHGGGWLPCPIQLPNGHHPEGELGKVWRSRAQILQCPGCRGSHDHWALQKPTHNVFHHRIDAVGRDSEPFSSGRRSRPGL
jgi:hypothetical protein